MRGEGEGTVVAVARTETRAAPVIRTVLEIPAFPPIDFIPNNRPAIVLFPQVSRAELALLPIEDVYEATEDGGVTTVQGDVNAVGLVALRFGYRVPTLPAPLDKVDLALLSDSLQRSVKEANVPAPFGLSALTAIPLVEIVCNDGTPEAVHAVPGDHAAPPLRAARRRAASSSTASASPRSTERSGSRSRSRSTSSTGARGPTGT